MTPLNRHWKWIACLFGFGLPLLLLSCRPNRTDIAVSDKAVSLNAEGVHFPCDPPLSRQFRTASLLLEIDGQWTISPPWQEITFESGKRTKIYATAITIDGQTFSSSLLGAVYQNGNKMVNIRFSPEIPKMLAIREFVIKAEPEIICSKVIWHDFDNL
ncbi:MAG: hypothetical protein WHS88_11920 [Anaerohalosphaeraceae bacterium]